MSINRLGRALSGLAVSKDWQDALVQAVKTEVGTEEGTTQAVAQAAQAGEGAVSSNQVQGGLPPQPTPQPAPQQVQQPASEPIPPQPPAPQQVQQPASQPITSEPVAPQPAPVGGAPQPNIGVDRFRDLPQPIPLVRAPAQPSINNAHLSVDPRYKPEGNVAPMMGGGEYSPYKPHSQSDMEATIRNVVSEVINDAVTQKKPQNNLEEFNSSLADALGPETANIITNYVASQVKNTPAIDYDKMMSEVQSKVEANVVNILARKQYEQQIDNNKNTVFTYLASNFPVVQPYLESQQYDTFLNQPLVSSEGISTGETYRDRLMHAFNTGDTSLAGGIMESFVRSLEASRYAHDKNIAAMVEPTSNVAANVATAPAIAPQPTPEDAIVVGLTNANRSASNRDLRRSMIEAFRR